MCLYKHFIYLYLPKKKRILTKNFFIFSFFYISRYASTVKANIYTYINIANYIHIHLFYYCKENNNENMLELITIKEKSIQNPLSVVLLCIIYYLNNASIYIFLSLFFSFIFFFIRSAETMLKCRENLKKCFKKKKSQK